MSSPGNFGLQHYGRLWPKHIIPSPEWQGLNERQGFVINSIWAEIDAVKRAIGTGKVGPPTPVSPIIQGGGGGGGGSTYNPPPGFQPFGAANTVLGVSADGTQFEYKTVAVTAGHLTIAFAAGSVTFGLPTVASAGTYGDASHTLQPTIDAQGRWTGLSTLAIAIAASQTTSGVFAVGRLGTGSPDATYFLQGDSTWQLKSSIVSSLTLAGDVTGPANANVLANTAVSAGSYGDATHAPSLTVNGQGRLTAAASNLITGVNGNSFPGAVALGDILYGSGAGALSKLAGNTTSRQQLLAQTGTGSVSAAPGWIDLIAPATWANGVSYASGNVVQGSDGNLYRCISATSSQDPTTDGNSKWEAFWIIVNTTLNVATAGGSRFTQIGGVGIAGTAWAFIQNAFIGEGATVTISVAAATYNIAARWSWNHPQGNQVKVTGAGSGTTILNFTGTSVSTSGIQVGLGNISCAISALTFQGATSHTGTANGTIGVASAFGSTVNLSLDIVVTKFDSGIVASNGAVILASAVTISDCKTFGIEAFQRSYIICDSCSVQTIGASSAGDAIFAGAASNIYCPSASVKTIGNCGFRCEDNSTIEAQNSTADTCNIGYFAQIFGAIRGNGSTSKNNTTGYTANTGGGITSSSNTVSGNTANYSVDGGAARDVVSSKRSVISS